MVGLLWKSEQFAAAIELVGFWGRLLQSVEFDLLCACPIDVFGKQFGVAATSIRASGERRFRALIENSSDAITLLNEQGEILYASASTASVLGYEPRELVGQKACDLFHSDDVANAVSLLQEALATPRSPRQMLARMRHKDGTWRWTKGTCANLLDEPDVVAVVVNYRDVSRWKSAEEARRRDSEQLARSNAKFQAFSYAAAHDLKEPLSTIRAYTQLLVERTELDKRGNELANSVLDGATRLSAMLDDMLSFSTLTFDDPPGPVDLNRIVDLASKNLERAQKESGAVITAGALPRVQGREPHLLRLFQNLFGNAIKYRSKAPVEIHVTASQDGHECIVRVKDNGIGISPKYHEHVFGLFKRLYHKEIPGTGLGLAICKKVVEEMGGRIWVESELGAGAEFCFALPAAVDANLGSVMTAGSGQK